MRLCARIALPLMALVVVSAAGMAAAADACQWSLVERVYPPVIYGHDGKYGPPDEPPAKVSDAPVKVRNVVLRNEHISIEVAVEAAGRVMRATLADGTEIFNVWDKLSGGKVWDGGGWRTSFPFQEHGMRYTDQPTGWNVMQLPDGSLSLAMDMRFARFTGGEELSRYGRFSQLRVSRVITLRPGAAYFQVATRVENPLPFRVGVRLWNTAQFPPAWQSDANPGPAPVLQPASGPASAPSTQPIVASRFRPTTRPAANEFGTFVLPLSRVSDHSGRFMRDWTVGQGYSLHSTWTEHMSFFSLNVCEPFVAVYYPRDDINRIRVTDPAEAPGAKLWSWPDWTVFYEVWTGLDRVFEQPGRFVEPFGAVGFTERYYVAKGIGRVAYANEHMAVGLKYAKVDGEDEAELLITPALDLKGVECSLSATAEEHGAAAGHSGTLNWPAGTVQKLQVPAAGGTPVRVVVRQGQTVLLDKELPLTPPARDAEAEKAILASINPDRNDPAALSEHCEMRDFVGLWGSRRLHDQGLKSAAQWAQKSPDSPAAHLQYGRLLERVGKLDDALAELAKAIELDGGMGIAHHLRGLVLLEQNKRADASSAFAAAVAAKSPAHEARYFLALDAIAAGDNAAAVEHLTALVKACPKSYRPRLALAALLAKQGDLEKARVLAAVLLAEDAASPEAAAVAATCWPDDAGRRTAAAKLLQNNPEAPGAVRQFVLEVEKGIWTPPPRPL